VRSDEVEARFQCVPYQASRVGTLFAVPADDLPVAEFAFPGPLRDQLVAAILAGAKAATTGLVADYEHWS
jgi:hypothetical protein